MGKNTVMDMLCWNDCPIICSVPFPILDLIKVQKNVRKCCGMENWIFILQRDVHWKGSRIFMDIQMPVMNGIEATRQIKALGRADSDVLIIAMTANILTRDRKIYQEAGMDGYISKPIDIKEIEKTLKKYVS